MSPPQAAPHVRCNLKIRVAEHGTMALIVEDEVVIHATLGPVRRAFQHGAGPQNIRSTAYLLFLYHLVI